MQFKDIIGQEAVKEKLAAAVNNKHLAHAFLFSGKEGVGKLALAIAFAQYISCTDKQKVDSCGKCPSCIKYQAFSHPDLHFVFPVFKKRPDQEVVSMDFANEWYNTVQSNPYITINEWMAKITPDSGTKRHHGYIYREEGRSIVKELSLATYESEYKIMIVWQADKMNPNCANALLKMIEEPPEKTVIILVTAAPEKIIDTIRSRTQIVNIPKISDQHIKEYIINKYSFSESEAAVAARLSQGSVVKADTVVNQSEENKRNLEFFKDIMRHCWTRKVPDIVEWSKALAGYNIDTHKSFLKYSLRMIRENFIMNTNNPNIVYLTEEEQNFSVNFSPYINEFNVIKIYSELEKAHSDIVRNGNAKLIFLDFGLKLVKLIRP